MKMTGAEILWECLVREGVEVVFGYPGGANMPIYDAMLNYPVHHVLVRHEQGAAHMADGYPRASGRVGVAMATSGPGATNLVTGIATAMMDSSPVVFITGQVAAHLIGGDAFQEVDVTGITLPITKHNYLVTRADEVAEVVREAFYIARSGRPGPVLIDICKNAQVEQDRVYLSQGSETSRISTSIACTKRFARTHGEVDRESKASAYFVRTRCAHFGRGRSADAVRGQDSNAGRKHITGIGRVPASHSIKPRHDGHARRSAYQPGHPKFRFDSRFRNAFR